MSPNFDRPDRHRARGHARDRARNVAVFAAALAGIGFAATLALADDGPGMPATVPKAYVQECGSCHLAYPPGLLPAASWQRIMSGLDRHYGSDASLDAPAVAALSSWLQANAARRRATEQPPEDRITKARWFEREHRRIDPAVWTHASVKSAANCAACHTRAEQGDFDDDSIRVPAGLDPRLARRWRD